MKTKTILAALAGAAIILGTGCVQTVDGRSRAGVPFINDKVEGQYERPSGQVFAAAKEVLAFNGVLYGENTLNSSLEAKIDTRTVWVRVEPVDPKVTKVIVQCRTKGGGTDILLAHEVEKQIALKLAR